MLRTVNQSVRIDEPPPSLRYHGRASTLESLVPLGGDRIFPPGVKHPILVVFTDGEEKAPPPFTGDSYVQQFEIPPFFVHIWAPTERHYVQGRIDPNYLADPTSGALLTHIAALSHGRVFREGDVGGLLAAFEGMEGPRALAFAGGGSLLVGEARAGRVTRLKLERAAPPAPRE